MNHRIRYFLPLVGLFIIPAAWASDARAVKCGANQDRVWVYESLNSFDVETKLKCGDTVEIVDRVKGYVKIRTASGMEGYVPDATFPDLPALPDDTDKPASVALAAVARHASSPVERVAVATSSSPIAPPSVPVATAIIVPQPAAQKPVIVSASAVPTAPTVANVIVPAPAPMPNAAPVTVPAVSPAAPTVATQTPAIAASAVIVPAPMPKTPPVVAANASSIYQNVEALAVAASAMKVSAPAAMQATAPVVVAVAKPAPPAVKTVKPPASNSAIQPSPSNVRVIEPPGTAAISARAPDSQVTFTLVGTAPNASPARDLATMKPAVSVSGHESEALSEDYPDSRPDDESADPSCQVFFSAYGLAPAQYKWLVENRRKQYSSICPAPDLSHVDFVILFAHDSDSYTSAMPTTVHTDRNGFSDFSPMTTVDTALLSESEIEKARYEFVWVFRMKRGTFDPANFSARRRPQFTTDEKGSHSSPRSIEDAFHFMEEQQNMNP